MEQDDPWVAERAAPPFDLLRLCAFPQDAGCAPGTSMEIDLGDANTVGSRMVTIVVGAVRAIRGEGLVSFFLLPPLPP